DYYCWLHYSGVQVF
nr:immunoglobulin light chain junction region [Macaca mulatta]MOW70947.1 immunoglobulin light chain junction region [Macaca mulatta]MOW72216.1 immunoglobulin light chain junction region [Macaca mulatta]